MKGPETPLGRRTRRIEPIKQGEAAECGLASLAMVANHFGHRIDLATLRRRFGTSSRGMTLRQLMQTADALSMSPRPLKTSLEKLATIATPAILHWDMNHFVVLERMHKGRALIVDPARGAAWHDHESLSKHYTGVALELRPAPGFEPEASRTSLKMRQLWSDERGRTRAFAQIALLSLVMQAYALASPYFLQIAVDQALPSADGNLVAVLGVGFLLFGIIAAGATMLRATTLLAAGTALSFGITANIARHLLRLPTGWFEKRTVGDVLSRFQSVGPIQLLLVERAPAALIDGVLALLTLGLMLLYSPTLAMIPVAGALAYAIIRKLTLPAERRAESDRIIASGKEQGAMIETIRGITTLRIAGRETMRQAAWQNRLSEALAARYDHEKVKALMLTSAGLVTTIETVALIWVGITMVIAGGFSVGMLFAFLAYRLQFATATKALIDTAGDLGMMKLHLDRLSDIALEKQDAGFLEPEASREFKGGIEVQNVIYAYGPHDPRVLDGINLTIEPGEHVAITGPSGGGKSTLVRILLGLADPDEGQVLIDGIPMTRYGRRAYREQVGTVLQEDVLFAGTIAENIAGFDVVDHDRLSHVLTIASVADDIEKMPMKHLTLVGDMGSTLSGGQRQRILLARALYHAPRLLIMDEGTAHLDAEHERQVNANIAAMGVTRIIIAHRRETIDAADRVVHLVDGKITDGRIANE